MFYIKPYTMSFVRRVSQPYIRCETTARDTQQRGDGEVGGSDTLKRHDLR